MGLIRVRAQRRDGDLLQPARRHGARRPDDRGAARPAHRHDRRQLFGARDQRGDVLRQDRLGARRRPRGAVRARAASSAPRRSSRRRRATPRRSCRAAGWSGAARSSSPTSSRLRPLHAVVTYPGEHFLRPSQFTPDLLEEGLGAAVEFMGRAEAPTPASSTWSCAATTCCRPARAWCTRTSRCSAGRPRRGSCASPGSAARPLRAAHGASYWHALVGEETAAASASWPRRPAALGWRRSRPRAAAR